MTYSSAGNGTWPHLATEMLLHRAGVKMVHVPYKGAAPALMDVIGGFIDAKIDSYVTAMPNIKASRLRALSVSSAQRMVQAPEIPTIAEQGFPGYAARGYQPAGGAYRCIGQGSRSASATHPGRCAASGWRCRRS
jgi:tripartite-type tricarboxylate transporter receptor subunit TctC